MNSCSKTVLFLSTVLLYEHLHFGRIRKLKYMRFVFDIYYKQRTTVVTYVKLVFTSLNDASFLIMSIKITYKAATIGQYNIS